MKITLITAALLLAGASAGPWRHNHRVSPPRGALPAASRETCQPATRVTIELTPICYHESFFSTTVIDPFGNGEYLTISSVPTIVSTSSTRTKIFEASTSVSDSDLGWEIVAGSGLETISAIVLPEPTSTGDGIETAEDSGQVTGPVETAGNTTPSSPGDNANTNTRPVSGTAMGSNSPPQTATASLSATSGAVTMTSPTSQELDLGRGVPTGTVTDLPDDQFIFLAISASSTIPTLPTAVAQAGGPALARRQVEPLVERRPLKLVDLRSADDASDNVSQDQCDSADPLLLRMGRLVQYDLSIGKPLDETLSPLGFLVPPPGNQIDQAFTLVDGILQWVAPDVGNALFYSCNGEVVAAFDEVMPAGCAQVVVGAIDGNACQERVEETRSLVGTFTPPTGQKPPSSVSESTIFTPMVPTSIPPATFSVTGTTSRTNGPFTNSSIISSTLSVSVSSASVSGTTGTLPVTESSVSVCDSPLQTSDHAINSRMSEALRTGNPDIVTESELLQQIPVSLDGRQTPAFDLIPDDTIVTWLLNPNTGYVRNPGPLDVLLIGNQNIVQSSTPANKTLAAIGVVPDSNARIAYFGGNPFITDDAGRSAWRPLSDAGLTAVVKNTVRYLVPIDGCNTTSGEALQTRQESDFSDLRIVLAQAHNGASETATLASLQSLFPGALINSGSADANACDFAAGQPNGCLAGANLLIVGDDANAGDDALAQKIAELHRAGLPTLVMGENGNTRPLSQKIMALLGVTAAQNYFNGRTVIDQATKEYLIPERVIKDQIREDALTVARYLDNDPLVPSDYSSCLSTTTSGVGDTQLKTCIEDPAAGVAEHAKPYFAALTRFRQVFDGLSGAGLDMFESTFGSQTEVVRVLALLSDKYRRGPGKQPGDRTVAIAYPVDLRNDGAEAGRSFYSDWLTPRTTKATGRPRTLGSLYCPTKIMAETDIQSCQSPVFPNVGNYPLTLRSAPEDRFTAAGFDQIPGRPSTVTLQTDPGFPVYIRFSAGKDATSRATLLSANGAVSTYNRPSFSVGPYVRLMPNVPITLNTPYGGPLYVRLAATSTTNPTDVQLSFRNVARHPTLYYPATDAEIADFAAELSTSDAYWADIVDDVFEIHSPIAKIRSALDPRGQDVEAPPRRVYYNGTNGLSELIDDFRNSWAAQEYMLAGLKVRSEPLSSTLSADDQQICSDLGLPCLNETINTLVSHQHVTYDSYSACGGLCSGNPITIGGDPKPIGYGEGHELGHNLQRPQLGIFWPDTNLGSQMSKIDSWANYVRRDAETSNNIFPIDNIYTYFRFTLPERTNSPPFDGLLGSHDPRKDVDTFSAHASAYSDIRGSGQNVVLDATCKVIGSYPVGTPSDVMLANAIWSNGAYSANNGLRLTFYVPLPDLLQGRTMSNGVTLRDGRDIFTLLYQAARAFTVYAADEATWNANRDSLGLSAYDYQDDVVYGSGKTVSGMIGNDFMLVLLCRITGYDFRPYYASRGVFYTALANEQVEANEASGSALRRFGKPFLALNTQQPKVNRTSVPADSPNAYKSNDVFFDTSDPATTWPGSDDDLNGTPEKFVGFHPRSCQGFTAG